MKSLFTVFFLLLCLLVNPLKGQFSANLQTSIEGIRSGLWTGNPSDKAINYQYFLQPSFGIGVNYHLKALAGGIQLSAHYPIGSLNNEEEIAESYAYETPGGPWGTVEEQFGYVYNRGIIELGLYRNLAKKYSFGVGVQLIRLDQDIHRTTRMSCYSFNPTHCNGFGFFGIRSFEREIQRFMWDVSPYLTVGWSLNRLSFFLYGRMALPRKGKEILISEGATLRLTAAYRVF